MAIKVIHYTDTIENYIRITFDNDSTEDVFLSALLHREDIDTYLDGGGLIYSAAPDERYIWDNTGKEWVKDLDSVKAWKIEETKQVAYDHIGAIIPAYANENIIELDKKKIQSSMISLPTGGSQMDKCVQIWDYFVTQKGLINAMTTIAEVEAYDPENDSGWPY